MVYFFSQEQQQTLHVKMVKHFARVAFSATAAFHLSVNYPFPSLKSKFTLLYNKYMDQNRLINQFHFLSPLFKKSRVTIQTYYTHFQFKFDWFSKTSKLGYCKSITMKSFNHLASFWQVFLSLFFFQIFAQQFSFMFLFLYI